MAKWGQVGAAAIVFLLALPGPLRAGAGYTPAVMHPRCLAGFFEVFGPVSGRPVSLEACNRAGASLPVTEDPPGEFSAAGIPVVGDREGDPGQNWLSYRDSGALPDGREALVVTTHVGEGSVAVSEVIALTRRGGAIASERLFEGGDRCSGGVESVQPRGDGLAVSVNVGVHGFLKAVSGEDYASADDYPADCFGILVVKRAYGAKAGDRVLEATVNGTPEPRPDDPVASCLLAALGRTAALARFGTYAAKDFPALRTAVAGCSGAR